MLDTLRGWRTALVALAYIIVGIAAPYGITPDSDTSAWIATAVDWLTSPAIVGVVMLVLRYLTATPIGQSEPGEAF